MSETGGGTGLAILCWGYLEDFCRDQQSGPVAELFDWFIKWTRQPSLNPRLTSRCPVWPRMTSAIATVLARCVVVISAPAAMAK